MDVRFKVPSNFYISGQSQCGKSYLVRRLLYYLNELLHPVPSKVIYCYGEYQKEFDELHGVDFIEGFPQDLNEITQGHDQTLLVLDDLMSECSKDHTWPTIKKGVQQTFLYNLGAGLKDETAILKEVYYPLLSN